MINRQNRESKIRKLLCLQWYMSNTDISWFSSFIFSTFTSMRYSDPINDWTMDEKKDECWIAKPYFYNQDQNIKWFNLSKSLSNWTFTFAYFYQLTKHVSKLNFLQQINPSNIDDNRNIPKGMVIYIYI